MLKFFMLASLIAAIGAFVLELAAPGQSADFLFAFGGFFLAAFFLKFLLDVIVYCIEHSKDDQIRQTVLKEPKAKIFYKLSEYANARRRRDRKR